MAFSMARLACLFANGKNTIYAYHSFNYNVATGVSTAGDVGTALHAPDVSGGQGYFYEARNMLRVGDIILAGVSRACSGAGPSSAGVSGLVVTHVTASSTAGVTVAGTTSFGIGAA
jgi:hypothetical protein